MALTLYDTLRRETVPFEPREPGRVSLYVCGPTVQSDAHVGHGRFNVVFDVLRRYLRWQGEDVLFVSNITDIDDKIIVRAARERTSTAMVAERYARAWNEVMGRLGILPPDIQPRATGHILEMQDLIQRLIDADLAYPSAGNVLFRVARFDGYGELSGRRLDDMQAGEDIVAADVKDDPRDFAMWKAAKPGEPSWPSPWGDGRPGWHIECSAMAAKHLGGGFDIHGGGLDLTFPHHENEIAQYEAAHGAPFARYWVHNGMVQFGGEKMSKSIGNIVALDDAITEHGRGPMRLWYLSAHHRSPLIFESDRLYDATAAFERLTTFLRTALLVAGEADGGLPDEHAGTPYRKDFEASMDDDLNAPRAVAALHELATAGHDRLPAAERGDEDAIADVRALAATLQELGDEVLGLGLGEVIERARSLGSQIAPIVDHLLERRQQVRAERDFAAADAIRDQLAQIGVIVEDRPSGPRWYVDPTIDHCTRG